MWFCEKLKRTVANWVSNVIFGKKKSSVSLNDNFTYEGLGFLLSYPRIKGEKKSGDLNSDFSNTLYLIWKLQIRNRNTSGKPKITKQCCISCARPIMECEFTKKIYVEFQSTLLFCLWILINLVIYGRKTLNFCCSLTNLL